MSTLRAWLLAALAVVCVGIRPAPAIAHSSSNSYLGLRVEGSTVAVQWAIALRDLDFAIGLDGDGDGDITWGELRAHQSDIDAYALARLRIRSDGTACQSGAVDHLADSQGDGGYAVLRFTATCPAVIRRLSVDYSLFFDLDPQHRGLVNLVIDGTARAAALSPAQRSITVDAATDSTATFAEFFKVGVDHLLTGIDHLLFITMLLVPAMFRRAPGPLFSRSRWVPVDQFGRAFIETVKVLSAFTVAHALTLTSATIGYIHLPSQLIEASIALTILATAIDNVWHLLPERRWVFAFCFGLIHGFGFANALGPLALPPMALAIALLAFNLGLETVQIAVAALVLPFGFVARQRGWYRRFLLPAASAAVGLVALAWFTDRASGLGFMPF